jgi:hypothetical protein
MKMWYILNDDKSVTGPVEFTEAKDFFEDKNRFLFSTSIGKLRISTVFLGLDHSFGGSTPVLFETMVFYGSYSDVMCDRYTTYEQAKRGHWRHVLKAVGWWLTFGPLRQ